MIKDRSGQRFGRLVLVRFAGRAKGHTKWECVCDCGNTTSVMVSNLCSGSTRSCGCLEIESRIKHGGHRDKENGIWREMWQRCTNPKNICYSYYGGRGVKVCDRWKKYENFIADVGVRPNPGMTLDRIDNNLGYQPGNVRWATRQEQSNNTRANRWLTFEGSTLTVSQWSRKVGVKRATIFSRLSYGWPLEEVLGFQQRAR